MSYHRRFLSVKLNAFSLTEVLITLAIVGILATSAVIVIKPLISKAKSTEAKLQLEHLFTMQKTYFMETSKYSAEFKDIGFEQAKLVTEGGNANYKLEVTNASNNSFIGRATAVTDFDGDGVFNVWEVDQDKNIKEVTPD